MWLPTILFATKYGSIPVQGFANAFKLAHMVATILYNRGDLRYKVEILVEYDTQSSGCWCWERCYCQGYIVVLMALIMNKTLIYALVIL